MKVMLSVLATGIAVSGCGSTSQQFQPTENVQGRTVEGLKEAFYDLATPEHQLGTVKVWSRGAYPAPSRATGTQVDVGFTIDNGSDTPIVFDPGATRLDSVQTERATLSEVPSNGLRGPVTVPARTSETVEMTFGLPPGIAATDVRAFRVRWTASAAGESYTEFTPFVETSQTAYVPVYAYYYPYSPFDVPYYDPYWRPHMHLVMVSPYPRRMIVHGLHHS